jgi:hypothetical protein
VAKDKPEAGESISGLVVRFINPLTYSVVLFLADGVARTLQIAADMLGARALSARKIRCRLRQRIYETDRLDSEI